MHTETLNNIRNTKRAVLAFCEMDIPQLRELLSDEYLYEGADKAMFLSKLGGVFRQFAEHGDTFLQPHKTICGSRDFEGCTRYSFVGNVSKKAIDFVFYECENELLTIYSCCGVQTDKKIPHKGRLPFEVYLDERANFNQTLEFRALSHEYNTAYEELFAEPGKILNKPDYLPWLVKHYKLYKTFQFSKGYSDYERFYIYYHMLYTLANYLRKTYVAKQAMEEFQQINPDDKARREEWRIQYRMFSAPVEDEIFAIVLDGGYIEVGELKINGDPFEHIIDFHFELTGEIPDFIPGTKTHPFYGTQA